MARCCPPDLLAILACFTLALLGTPLSTVLAFFRFLYGVFVFSKKGGNLLVVKHFEAKFVQVIFFFPRSKKLIGKKKTNTYLPAQI